MKIKDIQIDGFGVWSGLSVHSMPDTMTVFYGPNEAGKTTLMNFLRTMFYGFTSDRRQRYLPPIHAGKPGGAIRVTGPGGGYEITRRATLDQNGSEGSLTVTGNDGLAQGQHRLAMLLGQVDETIFTNVFAIGLRELQELSTLDDTAAADELYKLSSGLDRVSLVDVIRQLKAGRQQIAGPTPDHGQMQFLVMQREKLKEEIDGLSVHGRRWGELAALRKTQNSELSELKERIGQWELEARGYELAIQIRPTWQQHHEISERIEGLNARTDLPDEIAARLEELNTQHQEREEKLEEVRVERRTLREQARKLPLRRGILDLAAKIEAAAEHGPWITSMQKNIQRIEGQISNTKDQLLADAERLDITEEDRRALLEDRRMTRMPDLSRQAINQLAEPASEVRIWSGRLKQAKQLIETEKKETERLEKELSDSMKGHGAEDIQAAMQDNGEVIGLLRKRIQLQENLDKQVSRREELEEQAIDLTCDEALPVERSFLIGILFVAGAFLAIWGIGKLLGIFNTADNPVDTQTGLLFVLSGGFMLFFCMFWSNILDRTTTNDLEDVEDQIDALRKEIRKLESEKDEYDRRLPSGTGPLETRLRDYEREISSLEGLLPVQHQLKAAVERHRAARRKASQANESLKTAKLNWQRTLASLGLAESMSPKSVRAMAEGYDSLLQTRRRLQGLEDELETRQIELGNITQRIDALHEQVFAAKAVSDALAGESKEESDGDDEFMSQEEAKLNASKAITDTEELNELAVGVAAGAKALEQLNQLRSLVTSQEQYIEQKRGLREQDQQLAKQMTAYQKSIEKIERAHSALLAEHRCETEEQFLALLDAKHQHLELVDQQAEFADRIQAMVSGTVPFENVERLLDNNAAADLEKRWETIGARIAQAEERVEQLQLRQGELGQEMKSLAGQTRLSEAKLELACIENQLKACAAHWQTLAVTTGLLDKVCEVYETERQPETLREASAFLSQLTEGKYVRIWTPLGKNQLRIDNGKGNSLPLEVLSRGTREAVFIALRLSLAAAYARRGVTIPLVLDDVLVNFDAVRAESAGKVLRDFAALGHQVVMFTCHEHIMRIFHDIGVQVRVLPEQGQPGEAEIYYPELIADPEPEYIEEPEPVYEPEPVMEEVIEEPIVEEIVEEVVATEPEPEVVETPEPVVVTEEVVEEIQPKLEINPPSPKPKKQIRRVVVVDQEPDIDWLWYERNPESVDWGWVESDNRSKTAAEIPPDLWWSQAKAEQEAKKPTPSS